MTSILQRSPLLVFLALGVGAFAVERWLAAEDAGRRVITLTDEQVDALAARWDAQWGRPPTGRELRGLIDEAVREEILYREALRRGLDRGDPIVRRRLAQKMTFMLEDSAALPEPTAREVEEHFAAHAERYRGPGDGAPPPTLDAVRERVRRDLIAERRRERNRAALQALRRRHDVRIPASEAAAPEGP